MMQNVTVTTSHGNGELTPLPSMTTFMSPPHQEHLHAQQHDNMQPQQHQLHPYQRLDHRFTSLAGLMMPPPPSPINSQAPKHRFHTSHRSDHPITSLAGVFQPSMMICPTPPISPRAPKHRLHSNQRPDLRMTSMLLMSSSPTANPSSPNSKTSFPPPSIPMDRNHRPSVFPNSSKRTHPITPEVTLEQELPKEDVQHLLLQKKAVVVLESGPRVRSIVWRYMGRVKLLDSGLFVKEIVACIHCSAVYKYTERRTGTSTLRPHMCDLALAVQKEKKARDAKLGKMAEKQKQMKQSLSERLQQLKLDRGLSVPDGISITMIQDRPSMLKLSKGEGRHQQRELTPEGDDRKPVMPTPPPLKEHIMNSPSPQSVHPVSIHQGTPVSGGLGGGGLVNNISGRSNGSAGGCASPPPPTSKDTPPQQLLCVKWGNFDSNIVSMFSKLRSLEHFVDVTLWCEGKTIPCHKMILSACSMYFEKLLTEVPNPHPVIFLKDMRFWEIQALVEFMYRGEVSVHQDKLPNLLQAAESLQIKGLGSPTNEMGMQGNGDSMDEDMSSSTMDMTTNSSHNNSSSHLHNHINLKDDNGNNNNGNNNNNHSSLHHQLLAGAGNNSNNNHQAPWQKFGLSASTMMGIDLSNHGATAAGAISLSSLHGGNLPLPLSLSVGSPQSGSGSQGSGGGQASKRRKKETPRRIDLPRTAGLPLPAFNSTMGSEIEEDDDAASEDSMAAHERNHVDTIQSNMHQDNMKSENYENYADEDDCDQQENYEENDPGAQGDDDISSEHGQEMDEDQDGALSLRINSNLSDNERERSRKGNPMKKILGIGNNNNNNEGGPQNLIHNVSSGGD